MFLFANYGGNLQIIWNRVNLWPQNNRNCYSIVSLALNPCLNAIDKLYVHHERSSVITNDHGWGVKLYSLTHSLTHATVSQSATHVTNTVRAHAARRHFKQTRHNKELSRFKWSYTFTCDFFSRWTASTPEGWAHPKRRPQFKPNAKPQNQPDGKLVRITLMLWKRQKTSEARFCLNASEDISLTLTCDTSDVLSHCPPRIAYTQASSCQPS